MKKIFISYGNKPFKDTLKRIKKEARHLRIFDKVITYSEKDLPEWICQSSLFNYARGGGYWVWKPYVILKTMQRYPNALIIYADAGCSLNKNMDEWNAWFRLMETYEMLVTAYQIGFDYGWYGAFHTNSVEIATWTKKETLNYFDNKFGNTAWHTYNKIMAGFLMVKCNMSLIQEWLDTMLNNPNLVIDPTDVQQKEQYPFFVAHRHDQSILTPLVYYYRDEHKLKLCILPETAESNPNAAVVASRIKEIKKVPLKTRIIYIIKRLLGENCYQLLHFWN